MHRSAQHLQNILYLETRRISLCHVRVAHNDIIRKHECIWTTVLLILLSEIN
jgi:hypothetical protein